MLKAKPLHKILPKSAGIRNFKHVRPLNFLMSIFVLFAPFICVFILYLSSGTLNPLK